jgi:hypothetical protein
LGLQRGEYWWKSNDYLCMIDNEMFID